MSSVSSVPQGQESRTRRYRGADRLYLVGGGEHGQESPDVRITEEDKQLVRRLVAELEAVLSPEILFHLCCGIEEAVQRRRASA